MSDIDTLRAALATELAMLEAELERQLRDVECTLAAAASIRQQELAPTVLKRSVGGRACAAASTVTPRFRRPRSPPHRTDSGNVVFEQVLKARAATASPRLPSLTKAEAVLRLEERAQAHLRHNYEHALQQKVERQRAELDACRMEELAKANAHRQRALDHAEQTRHRVLAAVAEKKRARARSSVATSGTQSATRSAVGATAAAHRITSLNESACTSKNDRGGNDGPSWAITVRHED